MRLNRRGRARMRRGFRLTCVAIGGSNKLFMSSYCAGQQRGALRELLNARRFLAAKSCAKSESVLTNVSLAEMRFAKLVCLPPLGKRVRCQLSIFSSERLISR